MTFAAVEVAVVRRFPRGSGTFTYATTDGDAPEEGAFVRVPFRGRIELGVVLGRAATIPRAPLKPIASREDDAFEPEELAFYRALAAHTYESLATVFSAAIPAKPMRKMATVPFERSFVTSRIRVTDVDAVRALVDACRASHANVCVPSSAILDAVVAALIRRRTSPMLFLVPHAHAQQLLANIATACTKTVHLYGGALSKTAAYATWLALRRGDDAVMISTRPGALIVPSRDTHIVVVNSGSDDHRSWDQRPKIDARWCASTLHALRGHRVTFLDVLPRVDEGPLTYDGWRPYTDVRVVQFSSTAAAAPWFLTEYMRALLTQMPSDKRTIVYHNRLGVGSTGSCSVCGYVVSCDVCRMSLRPTGATLMCRTCNRTHPEPAICPHGHGDTFLTRGLGIERLARALSHAIPRIPVHIVRAREPLPEYGILVATQTLFSRMPAPETVSGVLLALADHLFVAHDFRSQERARRTVRLLVGLARDARAPFLAQAWQPELVSEALGPTEPLLRTERAWRDALHFPPTSTFVEVRQRGEAKTRILRNPSAEQQAQLLTLPSSYDIIVD